MNYLAVPPQLHISCTGRRENVTTPRIFKKLGLHAQLAFNGASLWAHDRLTNEKTRQFSYRNNCISRVSANFFTIGSGFAVGSPSRIVGAFIGVGSQLFGIWAKTHSSTKELREELLNPTYKGHLTRTFTQLKKPIKNWSFTQSLIYGARGISYFYDSIQGRAPSESIAATALIGMAISQSGIVRLDLLKRNREDPKIGNQPLSTWENHSRKGMKNGALWGLTNTAFMIRFGFTTHDHGLLHLCNLIYAASSAYLYLNCLDRNKLVEKQTLLRAQLQEHNSASRELNILHDRVIKLSL